jgi:hypothetical protein
LSERWIIFVGRESRRRSSSGTTIPATVSRSFRDKTGTLVDPGARDDGVDNDSANR